MFFVLNGFHKGFQDRLPPNIDDSNSEILENALIEANEASLFYYDLLPEKSRERYEKNILLLSQHAKLFKEDVIWSYFANEFKGLKLSGLSKKTSTSQSN